jgi:hypothetical protein
VSSSQKRNLAASVRQRLLSLSRKRAEPFVPLALTQEFATLKTGQWNAFIQRNKLSAEAFPRLIDAIHTFATPPLLASSAGERFPSYWSPGGNWKAASQE